MCVFCFCFVFCVCGVCVGVGVCVCVCFLFFGFFGFFFFFFFYYFPDPRKSCHSCRIWNTIAYFPDFYGSVPTKKSMNGVYKIVSVTE